MFARSRTILLAAAAVSAVAAGSLINGPNADAVTALPGWNGPLPSAIYSGFLETSASCSTDESHMSNTNPAAVSAAAIVANCCEQR
jgi:hypothetical protein